MSFMKGISTPKPNQYESVEDSRDLRIPVQSEEAFEHGICFKCKYVGTEEIPRPNSRVEIVAAMRRIRYEHKYRNIKKRKVFMDISADGIKVTLRKKKRKDVSINESQLFIMHYPVNRVFYVSHDSQDLKILSYIARGEDGIFRCSVFKALKKAQAMHMVRTIGQAFEVCHKINLEKGGPGDGKTEDASNLISVPIKDEKGTEETDIDEIEDTQDNEDMKSASSGDAQRGTLVTDLDNIKDMGELPPPIMPAQKTMPLLVNGDIGQEKHGAFTLQELQKLYHQQLLLQMQEAETSRAELTRVRDQLKNEETARAHAQGQVHRLLAQNRELIVVVQRLMQQVSDKHSNEHLLPINETWMLSHNGSMFGATFQGVDMTSEVFNNSHSVSSPLRSHQNPSFSSTPHPNKSTRLFEDLVQDSVMNIDSAGSVASSHDSDTMPTSLTSPPLHPVVSQNKYRTMDSPGIQRATPPIPPRNIDSSNVKGSNPFSPTKSNDLYRFAFDNTLDETKPGLISTAGERNNNNSNMTISTERLETTID